MKPSRAPTVSTKITGCLHKVPIELCILTKLVRKGGKNGSCGRRQRATEAKQSGDSSYQNYRVFCTRSL
jgi:hypothetical protein